MEITEGICSRVSVPRVTEPGPTREQLQQLLEGAMRAPDHGRLRPWRFVVITGKGRERLGRLFADARQQERPETPESELKSIAEKPLRAPMIITVIARVDANQAKIPVREQYYSAAAAAQNIMNMAHGMGLGAMWRTGWMAYHPVVKAGFGLDEADEIVGYVYLGTPAGGLKSVPELDYQAFTSFWSE